MNSDEIYGDLLSLHVLAKQIKSATSGGVMLAPNTVKLIDRIVEDTKGLAERVKGKVEQPSNSNVAGTKMSWEK